MNEEILGLLENAETLNAVKGIVAQAGLKIKTSSPKHGIENKDGEGDKKESSLPEEEKNLGQLREIDVDLLKENEPISFPIYCRADNEDGFSLLLPPGNRLTNAIRQKIVTRHEGKVYIHRKDWVHYAKKTDEKIKSLLESDGTSVHEKCSVFYGYATERMQEVFFRIAEEEGEGVMLVKPVAEHAFGMIKQDWKATFSLMQLAKREPQTYSHSLNVCFFGLSFIQNFIPRYSEKELKEIALGFLGHDIGELRLSESLRQKPKDQHLSLLERQVMQQVPLYGVDILKEAGCDYPLTVDIVLNHHERVDGTGYPRRLSQKRIPLLARVCSVCEAFDTLTTPQPYREGTHTYFEALQLMLQEQSTQFDAWVLARFIKMMGGKV